MPTSPSWRDFLADCHRYREDYWLSRRFWWITERSIWALATYRVGNVLREALPGVVARPLTAAFELIVMPFVQTLTGIELPLAAKIGPGLRIYHGIGLVMSGDVVLGSRCTLRQGVNLGKVLTSDASPRIGDEVDLGAYSQVLGEVTIGNRVRVGPHTVVLRDVADDATVFGVPGRVVATKDAPRQ